jgi:hypothetical protein
LPEHFPVRREPDAKDENYRAWVIRQIKDPFIKEFWADEFAG